MEINYKNESSQTVSILKEYKKKVQKELQKYCKDVINILDNKLIPESTNNPEDQIFYLKMKGDYYRYIAEFSDEHSRESAIEASAYAYQTAWRFVGGDIKPTHPVVLGLALNESFFYYDILKFKEKAITISQIAFENAIGYLVYLNEEEYNDSTLIMQLLKDNIKLWTLGIEG